MQFDFVRRTGAYIGIDPIANHVEATGQVIGRIENGIGAVAVVDIVMEDGEVHVGAGG